MKTKQILSNKAQGLSLNTVIIGIILLIVLAVTIWIFYKGTNQQSGFLDERYKELNGCKPGQDCGLFGKEKSEPTENYIFPFIPLGLMLMRKKNYNVT
jgi:hypothetical protein